MYEATRQQATLFWPRCRDRCRACPALQSSGLSGCLVYLTDCLGPLLGSWAMLQGEKEKEDGLDGKYFTQGGGEAG